MKRQIQTMMSVGGAVLVIVLDRVSKWFALKLFAHSAQLYRFIGFDLALNRGISFGFFHFEGVLGFLLVSAIVSIILAIIIVWAWRLYKQGEPIIGQLLIIAGGASNLFDRFMYGGVVDFISVSFNGWHWALFNIADVAIDVGVFVLLIHNFFVKPPHD